MSQVDDELRKGINDLPDEVLQKVFQYMDFKTLMTLTLVCKKWNEVIDQNTAIMKKIKLVFNLVGNNEMPKDLTRTYHTIEISQNHSGFSFSKITPSYLIKSWDDIFPTIEQCARNLRVLIIKRCRVEMIEIDKFNKLFSSLTNLESLSISVTEFFPSNFKIDLSPLVRLKSLSLKYSDADNIGIWKLPGTTQLKSLKVDFFEYSRYQRISDPNFEYSESLIDFLARQKSLEDLTILNFDVSRNFNLEKLNAIEFSLKRLALHMPFLIEEDLLLFMSKFVNSLEELYIHRKFTESFFEMIFTKFRKLKTLSFFFNEAPTDDAFYRRVQPNTSIRKLIADGDKPNEYRLKKFFGILPNIQTLDLQNTDLSKELMTFISSNLKMLVNLEFNNITYYAVVGVTIGSLKTLSVTSILHSVPNNWKKIVEATPNIEEFAVLHFNFENLLNDENIKIMAKGWPQLRHVKLGCGFVASKEIFHLFLFNFKNLRIVECFDSAFKTIPDKEKLLRDYERNGLTFIIRPYFWDTSFKTQNYFHKNWVKSVTGCD